MKRGYLPENPLKNLAPFDTTPRTSRRAMSADEIKRILQVAPEHRRLLYEVALTTGLRAGELRALTIEHLDMKRGGVQLEAGWTKNRKPGFQYLPASLLDRLTAYLSLVIEAGASVKEAMVLGRHSNPDLTMNTYARARENRLAELTEKVAKTIIPEEKCAICVLNPEEGVDAPNANLRNERRLAPIGGTGGGGIRTPVP